jgi:hypothetical protein
MTPQQPFKKKKLPKTTSDMWLENIAVIDVFGEQRSDTGHVLVFERLAVSGRRRRDAGTVVAPEAGRS